MANLTESPTTVSGALSALNHLYGYASRVDLHEPSDRHAWEYLGRFFATATDAERASVSSVADKHLPGICKTHGVEFSTPNG